MKVALGTFKDKGDELVSFLEPRVGTKPALSGDSIEIEDASLRAGVKPRQVKTYIKRFLYMNGVRKKYRIFVAGKELTIQEIEVGEEEEKEKKAPALKPEETPEEAAPEEPEAETPAQEEAKAEEPKAKPKKAAAKKPRAKKKKPEE
ncbi:MAG: hypothetical protein JRN06_06975 [Nitrososphaerota archaeon]|nr:hypothetical protein [Nitrososphaerota archaeon]MDG7024477.1 hypothetical protein [Nitrososphaerota archaeon]